MHLMCICRKIVVASRLGAGRMRIGEVSKLLNMSMETIRFYEKQEVIHPRRTGDGAYRDYELWDIFYLIDCIGYRNMGISLKEIVEIMHKESLEHLCAKIGRRAKELKEQICQEMRLQTWLENYEMTLCTAKDNVGNYWVSYRPEQYAYYVMRRNSSKFKLIESDDHAFSSWVHQMPIVESALFMPSGKVTGNDMLEEMGGCLVNAQWMESLGLREDAHTERLPKCKCICTIIDGGNYGAMPLSRYKEVISEIEQKGYRIKEGIITLILIARVWSGGAYHRYFKMMIPIE